MNTIFISTHSPFIINSIDNAKIYLLENVNCKSKLKEVIKSQTGWSIQFVLKNILKANEIFGYDTVVQLKRFEEIEKEILEKEFKNEEEIINLIQLLKKDGEEVFYLIVPKIINLEEITGRKYL